ncbi:MAG: hypothetical protein K0Q73_8315 [Paenibacillus sp.]|nr:hypothetical protein [Paenibacillus sp.]
MNAMCMMSALATLNGTAFAAFPLSRIDASMRSGNRISYGYSAKEILPLQRKRQVLIISPVYRKGSISRLRSSMQQFLVNSSKLY